MKCHKCGEDLDTGLNCYKCGYLDTKKIELEPTIAEKLLWLVENVKEVCIIECDFGHSGIRLDLPRNKFKIFTIFTTNDEVKNRDMLIDKAYKWVKEQKNAVNI